MTAAEERPGWSENEAKTLWVSRTRKRSFLERTARELLAGGHDKLILSALGDAIYLGIQIMMSLVDKGAVKLIRIETSTSKSDLRVATPSMKIYMQKDPNFKGSRTPPSYISCSDHNQPLLHDKCVRQFVSVIPIDSRYNFDTNDIDGNAVKQYLQTREIDQSKLGDVFKGILEKATEDAKSEESILRATIWHKEDIKIPDIRLLLCRPALASSGPNQKSYGAVFIVASNNKNHSPSDGGIGICFASYPRREDFDTIAGYTDALTNTIKNILTALCDYNGLVRREGLHLRLQRIMYAKIRPIELSINDESLYDPLVSAFIEGLEQGYCHGPAPRLIISDRDSLFTKAWKDRSGCDPFENIYHKHSTKSDEDEVA